MFDAADRIARTAFYVAADQWCGGRLVKVFGAFATAEQFMPVLRKSQVKCYYELIRENSPCKGYLDVEGEKGALTAEQGKQLLDTTLRHWFDLVTTRWPQFLQDVPQGRECIILDGSRPTRQGPKVSYQCLFASLRRCVTH